MARPRIGLIPSLDKHNNPLRPNPSRGCIDAISRTGGDVVVINYWMARRDQDALIKSVDALLFQGGGDIDPSYFGEPVHPRCAIPNLLRDDLELRAFELMYPRGAAMLGICRGAQLLNVAMGGTLYQDIPSELGTGHDLGSDALREHTVHVVPNTRLSDIAGMEHFPTNSLHHQSIKALGQGLIVSARTEDGVIEAVELPGHRFLMGLQWHPELTLDQDSVSKHLFQAFINSI